MSNAQKKSLNKTGIKIIFSVGVALVCLCLAEWVVRTFHIGPEVYNVSSDNFLISRNPVLRYEILPKSPDGIFTMNKMGLRDRDFDLDKGDGIFRIACIGDSICYGIGVTQDGTFPKRLEDLLQSCFDPPGIEFEVMNFGVTGYNITQVAEVLHAKVLPYDPDLVIYAYCLNDPQDYSFEMDVLLSKLTKAEQQYLKRTGRSEAGSFIHSKLWSLARYMLASLNRARKTETKPITAERDQQFVAFQKGSEADFFESLYTATGSIQRLERGLDAIARAQTQSGVPVVVVVFPFLQDLNEYKLGKYHDIVRCEADQRDLPVIDLLSGFQLLNQQVAGQRIDTDSLHPNGLGYWFSAAAILNELITLHVLPGMADESTQSLAQCAEITALPEVAAEALLSGGTKHHD